MGTAKKVRAWHQDVYVTVPMRAAAEVVDQYFFVADRDYEVVAVSYVATVAGSDGSAVTADVKVCADGEAPSAGTTVLGSTKINLKGTAATIQTPDLATTTTVAQGEMLALDITGTPTAVAGASVGVLLRPVDQGSFA